jgi:aryl-alcohol dehydrogenase-like predicted oxidoreductase
MLERKPLVQYHFLGRTGVRVSELCLGTMTFGVTADETMAQRLVDRFLAAGGNFIDTANTYGRPNTGLSETVLGKALLGKRDQVVLATKVRFVMGDGPNDAGLSRRHITEQVHASLRRLQTDRIDLYQIHCWDEHVPIADVLRTLDDLVAAGKVLHIGCSNLAGWQLGMALATSDLRGWSRFSCFQAEYSLVARGAEREVIPACQHEGLGVIAWSPLAGGFLSGKYHRDARPPVGSRLADRSQFPERHWRILAAVEEVAQRRGKSVAQVALAWLLSRPGLTAPILGVRTMEQLEDNLGALGWQLSPDDHSQLDEASAIEPGYPYDFLAGAVNRR